MRIPGRVAGALVAGTALVVVIALLATGTWSPFRSNASSPAAASTRMAPAPATTDPTAAFLDTYVGADGRVSRLDQGGDTVSEGQAYGLLLAVAARDATRFDRIWRWTAANLQRPDGLLSWTWKDGRVTDPSSAADADLDAAHALVAAGAVFGRAGYRTAGLRLGEAVLDHETAITPLGRVLTAGSWASTEPWDVNPSYASQLAVSYLGQADPDPRWGELATGDRAVLAKLLGEAALPPDWAQVRGDGTVAAMPSPANAANTASAGDVRFGLDAARVAVRAAASCSTADRQLAARLDRVLARPADQVRGAYDLGGRALVPWEHPLQLVAVAAASGASGDPAGEQTYLTAAGRLAQRAPTYYGAAWTALGRVLLTERSDLVPKNCPAAAAASDAAATAAADPGGNALPAQSVRSAAVDPHAVPVELSIPRIGVSSSLVKLGITGDGTLQVPTDFQRAGWLRTGPAPGERGPAVIAGHVDSKAGPAVFARLGRLRPGDAVKVRRADGGTVTFTVDGSEQVAKNRFPTADVYGPVPGPVLRLITCGGTFDSATGHYRDNVVVFASVHA